MNFKIIKIATDHEKALKRIDELFDSEPNTPEGDEFGLLTLLVDKFEEEHYPIDLPRMDFKLLKSF